MQTGEQQAFLFICLVQLERRYNCVRRKVIVFLILIISHDTLKAPNKTIRGKDNFCFKAMNISLK